MFGLFQKEKQPPTYEELARSAFTRQNLFTDVVYEMVNLGQGRDDLLAHLAKVEQNASYSKDFYVHAIRTNIEIFTLNHQTKDHLKRLVETAFLLGKCRNILHINRNDHGDYFVNKLVDVVYLLKGLDDSLRKGVPMNFDTIIDAVETLHQSLDEKLNEYYEESARPLANEVIIAKQLRIQYQNRKSLTDSVIL